jgi:hypothetical protein
MFTITDSRFDGDRSKLLSEKNHGTLLHVVGSDESHLSNFELSQSVFGEHVLGLGIRVSSGSVYL